MGDGGDDGLSETPAVCHDSHTDMRHKICKLTFIILVMLQQILSYIITNILINNYKYIFYSLQVTFYPAMNESPMLLG